MQPFYNDHTAYGAIVALMFPVTLYFSFGKGVCNKWLRLFFILMSVSLLLALILSYARAAWLSVIVAFAVYIIVRLNIRFTTFAVSAVLLGLLLFLGWQPLMQQLEKNAQDSSGNILEHITSMSNISTDASNVERLNRWSCALRMWKESPITGFGPGTYQFQYASYQKSYQKTWISTDFGTLGNAHSEYLGPLSEMGVLGTLSVMLIFGMTMYCGFSTYRRMKKNKEGKLALWLTISLITYYVHGFMNNFLDTDKLSVPFWAFTAAIVSLNILSKKKLKTLKKMA
jgi:O-antigen ligase